jgi:8-oxo-dGTP pyrophosphatase MutT (NUDIX family)
VAEAAARESLEEAGVRGELQARGVPARRLDGAPPPPQGPRSLTRRTTQELGTFNFTSKSCRCVATVFVMLVTEARLC